MKKLVHAFVWWYRIKKRSIYPADFDAVLPYIRKGPGILVDIGAHGGAWSFNLAPLFPASGIFAFEAYPYYAGVLRIMRYLMRAKNVHICNMAVSDKPGTLRVRYKDQSGKKLTGFTHIADQPTEKDVEIKAVRLDDFFIDATDEISLIKCDVEGFEWMIFKGAADILERSRPVVYCELNSAWCKRYNYQPKAVFDIFLNLQYKVYVILDGRAVSFTDFTAEVNDDFLFIHEK